MDWIKLAVLLLQLARAFFDRVRDDRQYDAGQDAEIAANSLAILRKTAAGKKLMEKIDAMDAADVGGLLDQLERG
jgi:hypothetical protein